MVATQQINGQHDTSVRPDQINFEVYARDLRLDPYSSAIRKFEVIRKSDGRLLGIVICNPENIVTEPSSGDTFKRADVATDYLRFRALVVDMQLEALAYPVSS